MKTLTRIGLVAGILVVAGGTIAWGGKAHRGQFMQQMMNHRIEKALDYIDATPAQRKVVDEAKQDIVAKLEAGRQAHKDAHEQFVQLLTSDSVSQSQLDALVDSKAEAMKTFARSITPDLIKIHDTLTSAQRQKLAAHFAEMKAKHGQHHQDEQGGFGGPQQ